MTLMQHSHPRLDNTEHKVNTDFKGSIKLLGEAMLKCRLSVGLCRSDVSVRMRICEGTLRRLEHGHRASFPSSFVIHMASYLFKKPTEWFFIMAGYELPIKDSEPPLTFGNGLDPRKSYEGDGYVGGRFMRGIRRSEGDPRTMLAQILNLSSAALWALESGYRKSLPLPKILNPFSKCYRAPLRETIRKFGYIV